MLVTQGAQVTAKSQLFAGKAAFDRDCLQLARDCATLGRLYEAETSSAIPGLIWPFENTFKLGFLFLYWIDQSHCGLAWDCCVTELAWSV